MIALRWVAQCLAMAGAFVAVVLACAGYSISGETTGVERPAALRFAHKSLLAAAILLAFALWVRP